MCEQDVVIVSAVRTPIGSFQGALSSLKASDLGSIVIKECLLRAGLKGKDVSEVAFGQVLTAAQGQNPARQAAIKAGLPVTVPAYLINMLCGSSLKAIALGYLSVKAGECSIVVAGGQESMSQAPHAVHMRNGLKMGDINMIDTMLFDGLTCAFIDKHMGITAENISDTFNIGREAQDMYALQSQERAQKAISAGFLKKEIVDVPIKSKKETIHVMHDEYPRQGVTLEQLSKMKPAFDKTASGTVTAGNASGINDGAAAVILMSAKTAAEKNVTPLAKIVAFAETGVEPCLMGTGPITAIQLVLEKTQWKKEEVDLFELNEAFAVQALACIRTLELDPEKVNIYGGAIAFGHPIGASGARIVVTLLHALIQTDGKRGIASLCVGGGMGIAIALERL